MNYIEIDMNGRKVGLKFAYPQAKEFAIALPENANLYFEADEEGKNQITTFGIAKLLYTAYKNNCLVKEVQPTLTLEDFSDYIDENHKTDNENFTNQLLDVLNVWEKSKYTKLYLDALKKKAEAIQNLLLETVKNDTTNELKPLSTPMESESES